MCTLRGGKITLIRDDGTHGLVFTAHTRRIKIGSSISCDIRIKNDITRKVHCIILPDTMNNVIQIKNLSKKNPVLLNGVPIKKYHVLKNRDTIRVAQRQFLWTYASQKSKRSSSSKNCAGDIGNGNVLDVLETKDGDETTVGDVPLIKCIRKSEKHVGRRITCKINKIPIGNIGKRLHCQQRITIHDFRDGDKIEESSLEQEEENCEDIVEDIASENKLEDSIMPIIENDENVKFIDEKDVENDNNLKSRSMGKINNATPLQGTIKLQDGGKIEESSLEQDKQICENSAEEIENTLTKTNDNDVQFIDEKDVENDNTAKSRSMVKNSNATPLKDITKLQERNVMTTPKGNNIMLPLEASTPFQMFHNKNLSIAKLEKSDSLVWSLSPATISHRGKNYIKSFTTTSQNTTIANELIDVDTPENTVIKKTISSSVYLIDLTTPNSTNFNTSQQRTPNKSLFFKSTQKNSSINKKSPNAFLHATANSAIKRRDRSSMVTSSLRKVLNMTNTMSTTSTPTAEKRKLLFLNKSVTQHSTKMQVSPKTSNLSLSTINRKTVNMLESFKSHDKRDVDDKSNCLAEVGTSCPSLRKSMLYATPGNKTTVKDRVATPGRIKLNHSGVKVVNEELKPQADKLNVEVFSNIPASKYTPTNDLTDVAGGTELLSIPPHDNLQGIKELMKTPGNHSPTNDLTDVRGVKELLNTPVQDDLRDVRGVRELFNTPHEGYNPDFTVNFDTFTNIINSPCDFDSGAKNVSVCTLPSIDIAPETTNVDEFEDADDQDDDTEFNEDFVSKNTSLDENKTMDERFDELVGKKTVIKTYSRNKSKSPEKRANLTEFQTENIEKWVESVVNVVMDEVQPKPNNNQQILSNRYSNVTPQTSVVEPSEHHREDTDEDDESDKQSSHNSEDESMFKKMAINDPIDPHVSFRFENYDLSSASNSDSDKSEVATQLSDILNESALLNEETDHIIPNTQQQETPIRKQLESNFSNRKNHFDDSKDTFVIEDEMIIPETQVEVFQGDTADDVNEFGLEMSSQALETNISLVLNGEEEILSGLVDNNDDSHDTYIVETQMSQNEQSALIADRKNDSSILFIDDTIFMDKSKATPTQVESDHDSDDSSIILCNYDSIPVDATRLRRTRSKSETPKKMNLKTPRTARKTMGNTLNENIITISKLPQGVDKYPLTVCDTVEHLTSPRRKSKSVSPQKQPPKSTDSQNKSIDIIDLSESFNESENGSVDSEVASTDEPDKLESDISGIEPLVNDETSCVLVYENSGDEIKNILSDHIDKDVSINASSLDVANKSASQMIVEELLGLDSDVFQNFDENKIIQKAHGVSLSPEANKTASQMIVDKCLEMDSDIFQNFDENDIVLQARRASLSTEDVIKTNKVSRKTIGDHLDIKEIAVSTFRSEINDINMSVGEIDQIPQAERRRAQSLDRIVKSSSIKDHDKTISENSCKDLVVAELECEDKFESWDILIENTPGAKIDLIDELNTTSPTVEIVGSFKSCDDSELEHTQLRPSRSKSETPIKVNTETFKTTRKTMGEPLNYQQVNITKYQQEVEKSISNEDENVERLTIPRTKSKSISPQKLSPKTSNIIDKSGSVIDLSDSDEPSIANDMSSCVLIYADSEDEMIDSVFDIMEQDSSINSNRLELENKTASQAIVEECFEMQNFNENEVVRQAGISLSPVSNVKSNSLSRKTMGDQKDLKGKVTSKFEAEINEINVSVGDIEQIPIMTASRRYMSIGDKAKSTSLKASRKTMGDQLDLKEKVPSKFEAEVNEIDLSEVDIEQIPIITASRRSMSIGDKAKSTCLKASRKTMGDQLDLKEKVPSKFEAEVNEIDLSVGDIEQTPIITASRRSMSIGDKAKSNSFKASRKTMGDQLDLKEKVSSKFEAEVNEIDLSVGDIEHIPIMTASRRSMSIGDKAKSTSLKASRKTMGDQLDLKEKVPSKFEAEVNEIDLSVGDIEQRPIITASRRSMSIGDEAKSTLLKPSRKTMGDQLDLKDKVSSKFEAEVNEIDLSVGDIEQIPIITASRRSMSIGDKAKSHSFKASRKTMGDQINIKEKVSYKFECEVNEINLSVGDIKQEPIITARRRAMSIGSKVKPPPTENIQNKTISEINCEEPNVAELYISPQLERSIQEINDSFNNPPPQSSEIEKVVNMTVIDVPVIEDIINVDDTFGRDESENLFNDEESEMIVPETQEILGDPVSTNNSASILIIPETQPDPEDVFDVQITQPEKLMQNRSSQLHRLSLNSPIRTKSPNQIKPQSPSTQGLPKILVENVKVVEDLTVLSTPATRKRRLYSKDTYTPVLGESHDSAVGFENNPTSTPFSKNRTNFDVLNFSKTANAASESSAKLEPHKKIHTVAETSVAVRQDRQIQESEEGNTAPSKRVRRRGKLVEDDVIKETVEGFTNSESAEILAPVKRVRRRGKIVEDNDIIKGTVEEIANPKSSEIVQDNKDKNEIVESNESSQIATGAENAHIEKSSGEEQVSIENTDSVHFKLARRVAFADKPEEKYFEVLSEYEESIKKPVRGRRPLLRDKAAKIKINLADNMANENIEKSLVKRSRGRQFSQQGGDDQEIQAVDNVLTEPLSENSVAPSQSKDEMVEAKQPGEKGKRVAKKKDDNYDETVSDEPTNDEIVEKKTSGKGKGRRVPAQKKVKVVSEPHTDDTNQIIRNVPTISSAEIELISVAEETGKISDEQLQPNNEEIVERKMPGRGKGRRAPAKKEISVTKAEDINKIATSFQAVPAEILETIRVVENATINPDEHLEPTHGEIIKQKVSGRSKGRRAPRKKGLEMISEFNTDNINENTTDLQAFSIEDLETILIVEESPLISDKTSHDEIVQQKSTGRDKTQRGPTKRKAAEVSNETSSGDKNEIAVSSEDLKTTGRGRSRRAPLKNNVEISSKATEEVSNLAVEEKTTGRGRSRRVAVTKNEVEVTKSIERITVEQSDVVSTTANEIELSDVSLVTPVKRGRGRAVNKKYLNQESENESMTSVTEHEEKETGRGRGRASKKKVGVISNIDHTEGQVHGITVNIRATTLATEVFATPTKPAVRGRRPGIKKIVDVTDSESEQVSESPSAQKRSRTIKKPARYLDDIASDGISASSDHSNEILDKSSRGRKVVVTRSPKPETPVKLRGRRGAPKQAINGTENENVVDTSAKELSELVDHYDASELVSQKAKKEETVIESVKEETPVKSRVRRSPKVYVEKISIPAKRGRKAKNTDTPILDLSTSTTESVQDMTPISTKSRSRKNEIVASVEQPLSNSRLKRKAKDDPSYDENSISKSTESKNIEIPKVSRVTRSRAK